VKDYSLLTLIISKSDYFHTFSTLAHNVRIQTRAGLIPLGNRRMRRRKIGRRRKTRS